MIKIFSFRKIAIVTLLLFLALILYNYPEEINKNIHDVKNDNYLKIFLLDKNDLVSMTKVNINTDDLIRESISTLTMGADNVPLGFEPIIPFNTKLIDYSLVDGILKVNFSKEFLNIKIDYEEKLIQSLIYSLTAIDGVNGIIIFVDGVQLTELPNSHKRLDSLLDRSYGINTIIDINSISDTQMVTIYYLNKYDDYYYIPVSYISNNHDDKIEIIVNSLKSNKFNSSNLSSHLNYQVELMNYEANYDEFVLNFNDSLLTNVFDGKVQEEVKYALSYSIYDTFGVKKVIFQINSNKIDEFVLEN